MTKSLTDVKISQLKKRQIVVSLIITLLAFGAVTLLMLNTTPDEVGPLGITMLFTLVFIGLLSLGMLVRSLVMKQPKSTSKLVVILSATATIAGLAIGTIDLDVGDVILLGLFVVTFSVYWTKLR